MAAIVQINFDADSTLQALEEETLQAAPIFKDIAGLIWKIWLGNTDKARAGGIYLFDTLENAEAYSRSDLVNSLRSSRQNVSVDVFETLKAPNEITAANVQGL